MRPDSSHAEARALRVYVEAVAAAVGVESTAAWQEYGPPSSAYVALADLMPDDRLLMLQWNNEDGWALAVEPAGVEPPVILAAWPERVFLTPADLAAEVRRALTPRVTVAVPVSAGEKPRAG
ncbi:DUF6292 family protein [Actinophytocola sp.]|uniref:DUF6292 family protein n=1 Tax=Actinophytocola sp. TaxID=1872138 RepID=UPI002D39E2C5|nr:DUF6292 family protein [Actinophytocola sp.]HYQ63278.1 DUF6292 family protein [Actinophytocola sp.]